jgi:hypothetical protein
MVISAIGIYLYTIEQTNWPEGPQLCKWLQFHEPDGWAHSNLSWQSNRYIDHPGSLYPKQDKAECCHCLGALKCQGCGMSICPCTKSFGPALSRAVNHTIYSYSCTPYSEYMALGHTVS